MSFLFKNYPPANSTSLYKGSFQLRFTYPQHIFHALKTGGEYLFATTGAYIWLTSIMIIPFKINVQGCLCCGLILDSFIDFFN